jgi:hypothetical protein
MRKPSPKALFDKYIKGVEKYAKDRRIEGQKANLSLRNWNLYFFAKEGINNDYAVWCQKLGRGRLKSVVSELHGEVETLEFLWDLCWAKRNEYINRDNEEFLALVLEQELNDWVTPKSHREEAWWDFTKILFAEVRVMRVFIGKSSNQGFETAPKEYADYYKKVDCRDVGLLLILINWRKGNKNLTIGGWELTKSGEAKPLVAEPRTFEYSGKV